MANTNRVNANAWQAFNTNNTQGITGVKNILTGTVPPTGTTPSLYPALYINTSDKTVWYNGSNDPNAWVQTSASINGSTVDLLNERVTSVAATAGAITVDLSAGNFAYTTTLSGTTTLTISNAATALTGLQSRTIAILSSQSAASAFINAITITGATSTTVRWFNGNVAPTSGGNAGAQDLYQITIVRTAANTYTVLANRGSY